MSLYSTSIATAIIDPSFTSTRRCEFRIPFKNQAYLPNLRLGNVGVTVNATTAYALGCGVSGIIKRIVLLDGEEEIDSLREANAWLTFKSFMRPNTEAESIKIPLEGGGGRGFTSSTSMEVAVPAPFQKYATVAGDNVNSHLHTGTIDLRTVFPILNSITHLSTNTFQNLRIVIEYETDQARIVVDTTQQAIPVVPILMADEITDEALIATLDKQLMANPVFWDTIEVDRIGLKAIQGAGADLTSQQISLQSNGFLGKYVKRLCIQKSPQDPSLNVINGLVQGFGGNGSVSQHSEQINLRVNGRSLVGGQGYVTPAQIAMAVSDTWGELNCPPYGAIESVGLDGAGVAIVNAPAGVAPTEPSLLISANAATARHSPTTGQLSYCAFRVDSRMDALQIEYGRSGRLQSVTAPNTTPGQGGTAVALDLTVYAEVSRSLMVMGGGQWKIQYV